MRTLIIVRHGETIGNSSIRYFGRTDLELSELGRAQMQAARRWLGNRFGAAHVAPVLASPLRRATEGAAIIAGPDRSIVEIEEFVEVDFGRFEGLTAEEIAVRYPVEFELWNRDRLDPSFSYPGGESRRDFTDRVRCGIQRMLSIIDRTWHPRPGASAVALLVAHRGVIRIVCNRLAGVEPQIELGSIQILECDSAVDDRRSSSIGAWRARAIDIVEHLPSEE